MNIFPALGTNQNVFVEPHRAIGTEPIAVTYALVIDAQTLSVAFFVLGAITATPFNRTNIHCIVRSID